MAQKWNLQDIVPKDREKKRSEARSAGGDIKKKAEAREEARETVDHTPRPRSRGKKRSKLLILFVVIPVFLLGFFLIALLGGAEVTIYPKVKDATVDSVFTAHKAPMAGELGYELLTLVEEGEQKVKATGQEEVSERAGGKLTVYNAFSTSNQRLIKNTRFESSDKKIFRITQSIDIPGYKKKADGSIEPGSVQVEVLADATGDTYNGASGKFTVPGLKDTDQYEKIYAEAVAPMQGGFEGTKYIVDDEVLAKTREELHSELRDKLLERLKSEQPNGFIFYDSSIKFVYTPLPATDAGDQFAVIKEKAELQAPLFKEDDFARAVASQTVEGYSAEPVRLEKAAELSFSYPSPDQTSLAESFTFLLKGDVRIIWKYDPDSLRKDLAGISKEGLLVVLSGYPSINKGVAVIRPFWKSVFPNDIAEIKLIEKLEE